MSLPTLFWEKVIDVIVSKSPSNGFTVCKIAAFIVCYKERMWYKEYWSKNDVVNIFPPLQEIESSCAIAYLILEKIMDVIVP